MAKNKTNQNKRWQDSIQFLPWNPKQSADSAVKALSLCFWQGVPKHDAIDAILLLPEASYVRENPFILFAAWEVISREFTGESELLLETEPLFDIAA